MTAVASPPSLSPLPRDGYVNGALNTMSQEELSRSFLPRKSVQRAGSSSSISSNASTIAATSIPQANGSMNGDTSVASRKKPARVWPASKSDPVSGISMPRSQSVPPATSSATNGQSTLAALAPSPIAQQPASHISSQINGVTRPEATAILHLTPMNGTFERKTITVPYHPEAIRIGRQTNPKTIPTPTNGYFDSKVLSRQHAEIWADRDGSIFIRDVKSSNGTFVNSRRLSAENKESDPTRLSEQDVLELGIDIVSEDQKSVVHHKVAARVEHAGVYPLTKNALDVSFNDLDHTGNPSASGGQILNNARGRSPNQSALGNHRLSNSNLAAAGNMVTSSAYHAKWLQPITMEQVVKKLNTELRQARLQSQDLHHSGSYVDAVLHKEVSTLPPVFTGSAKPASPWKTSSPTKISDIKARFASEPPAPPPTQPLPDKPDSASRVNFADFSHIQPPLLRSDTEKSKPFSDANGSSLSPMHSDPSHQILNLIDRLNQARMEIDSQSTRIRQMEELLQNEREARTSAEERALQLESDATVIGSASRPKTTEDASDGTGASLVQQKLDLMQSEMSEMREQMETYRLRAEEAEGASRRDRQSLEDMVESITRRTAEARQRKNVNRGARATLLDGSAVDGSDDMDDPVGLSSTEDAVLAADDELDLDSISKDLNGHVDPAIIRRLERSSTIRPHDGKSSHGDPLRKQLQDAIGSLQGKPGSLRQDHLVNTAPLASILGVVLLGVGMMAYLNGWQKVSER